jgi:tetratricopeptide (TPR) repeat protein
VRLHRKIVETVTELRWSADFEHFVAASQVGVASRASLEAALHLADGEPPHPETVRLLTALSKEASIRVPPDWDAREHYARAAVDMAEQLDAPVELSATLDTLATVYGERGLFRERVQVALRRLALSHDRRASDLRERADALLKAGKALTLVGRYAQAMPHFLEAEGLSGQTHSVYLQRVALEDQAYCWFRLDRWDDMFKIEEKWRDIQQRYPQERTGPLCFSIALSACARALRGERDQAASLRQEAYTIMTLSAGPPERWVRSHHY